MQKTIRQHYVPQFYLGNFTNATDGIWVYDKVTDREYLSGPNSIGFEKLFYEIDLACLEDQTQDDFNRLQMGEQSLAKMEGVFKSAIDQVLTQGPVWNLDSSLQEELSLAVAIQWLRTPSTRDLVVQQIDDGLQRTVRSLIELNDRDIDPDIVTARLKTSHHAVLHLRCLFDVEFWRAIGKPLLRHNWVLGVNHTGTPLYTSDHPVIRIAHSHGSFGGSMFSSKGIEILYPLSPTLLLMVLERSHHRWSEDYHGKELNISPKHLKELNEHISMASRRFIFSCEPGFQIARSVCQSDARFRDPERPRVHSKVLSRKKRPNGEIFERTVQIILDDITPY